MTSVTTQDGTVFELVEFHNPVRAMRLKCYIASGQSQRFLVLFYPEAQLGVIVIVASDPPIVRSYHGESASEVLHKYVTWRQAEAALQAGKEREED